MARLSWNKQEQEAKYCCPVLYQTVGKTKEAGTKTIYRERSSVFNTDTTVETSQVKTSLGGPIGELPPGLWESYMDMQKLFPDLESFDTFMTLTLHYIYAQECLPIIPVERDEFTGMNFRVDLRVRIKRIDIL